MKHFMETWGTPIVALMLVALMLGAPLYFAGCEHVERVVKELDVAVCYVHPELGRVCVQFDGKLHINADIVNDPAKLETVREWIKDKLPEGVTLEPVSRPTSSASSGTDPPK